MRRISAIRAQNRQSRGYVVVVDEVFRQIIEVQQDTVAQRHDAAVIEPNKAFLPHRGFHALNIFKADEARAGYRV